MEDHYRCAAEYNILTSAAFRIFLSGESQNITGAGEKASGVSRGKCVLRGTNGTVEFRHRQSKPLCSWMYFRYNAVLRPKSETWRSKVTIIDIN